MNFFKLFESFISENRIDNLYNVLNKSNEEIFDLLINIKGVDSILNKLGLKGKTGKTASLKEMQMLASALDRPFWYSSLPVSYFFSSPEKLPESTSLLHFTNRPDEIIKKGFIHGTEDFNKLGMSWGSMSGGKPGWNYAFRLEDIIKYYGSIEKAKQHWGREKVIEFEAPGILVWHHGDQVDQVLFWGPDAKNIRKYKSSNG
jgi:hypothetical protein